MKPENQNSKNVCPLVGSLSPDSLHSFGSSVVGGLSGGLIGGITCASLVRKLPSSGYLCYQESQQSADRNSEKMNEQDTGPNTLSRNSSKRSELRSRVSKVKNRPLYDLAKRAKGDPGKVKIAGRLREETLVTVKWIVERLGMGTAGYVNNRLYRWRKGTMK